MTAGALGRAAAGLLVALLAGCASQRPAPSAGDAAFARGDLATAVASYDAESAGDPENLSEARRLRLALALAASGESTEDRTRARAILTGLGSAEAVGGEAAAVLALVDRAATAEERGRRLAVRLDQLRAEVERCDAEVATLGERRAEERAAAARVTAECERLRARVADLEDAVDRRDAELAELRAMIEDLKHVDLDPEP